MYVYFTISNCFRGTVEVFLHVWSTFLLWKILKEGEGRDGEVRIRVTERGTVGRWMREGKEGWRGSV